MNKIAIVMIHGMGEQRPMDTLRGFVETAWVGDAHVISTAESTVYSKPDDITGSFELRRITTQLSSVLGGRCDFFEFYWAHLMNGNRASAVIRWLVALLVRWPWTVPGRLVAHWLFGLAVLAVLALAAVYLASWAAAENCPYPPQASTCRGAKAVVSWIEALPIPAGYLAVALGLLVLVRYLMPGVFAPIVGDAARYFTPRPDNIAARQAIRTAGVELIQKLHEDGDYKRIILVAHSLGSAVGYDVLTHAWARLHPSRLKPSHQDSATQQAMADVEAAAGLLNAAADDQIAARRADYRDKQRAYFARIASPPAGGGNPVWLVSDFVTMGSPLSKADVLVAYDRKQLDAIVKRREAPTCPPEPDLPPAPAFSFAVPEGTPPVPHHAAVFGPTVWTNIYFPNPLILWGDLVGGETAPRLGRGIADIRLKNNLKPFRHLDYWAKPHADPPRASTRALRAALNLRLLPEAQLWGPAIAQRVIRGEDVPL